MFEKTQVIGAFAGYQQQGRPCIATRLVKESRFSLNMNEPEVCFPGELHLNQVTHGYRDKIWHIKSLPPSPGIMVTSFESIGFVPTTTLNVLKQYWQNQVRSACMLVTNGKWVLFRIAC